MGDAGFMIPVSSIMNTSYQNQPAPAIYNFSEQSPLRNSYGYSPTSDSDFCIATPPPAPSCNIVSSTTMPTGIIANGNYCMGSDLQPQVPQPYLRIVEEPQSKIRYRYASEKGAHGGMQGESSSSAKKTFPTVKLENAPHKKIYIKASLYTNEDVPKPHVHKLTGKHCDKDNGECIVDLNEENQAVFQGLGINFTGKKEVHGILLQRIYQEFVTDCATKGFPVSPADEAQVNHRAEAESKCMKGNLNSVRICFEAFEAFDGEKPNKICRSIFSRSVQNQKSSESGELKITRISACSGACTGDDEVFLLCEKVNKKDIKIRFYEDFEDGSSWEAYGNFNDADVHHQVAIVFRTPPYKHIDIQEPVSVFLELYRMKDNERSEPVRFIYKPVEKDLDRVVHKRKKLDCSSDYSTTTYATQPSFSGSPSVGVRTPRMPASYSQGHMSPSYQSRGNAQPQESAVPVLEEIPDSDSDDVSDLMTFPSPSSTESSTGVSSSTDPTAHIPNASAHFDEEMPTSTVDLASRALRGDPMWSRGISSGLPGEDDADNTAHYFSDCASLDYRSTPQQMLQSKNETRDIYLTSMHFEPESKKKSQHLRSPEQKLPHSKTSVSRPRSVATSGWLSDPIIGGKAKNLRVPADRRHFTSGGTFTSGKKIVPGSQHQMPADRKKWRPTSGGSSEQIIAQMESPHPLRIGTIVLTSRGSTETPPSEDVRVIVQNVARALRHFLASGDVQLLLYPMRDLMGVTDEDGDNAVHHIALHEGTEPQFVDASLRVVQHLPHTVINQTNNHYQTPLQLAVAVRKLNVLKWLLACGANPNVRDMQGHSALHLAVLKHHHDCLSVLLRKDLKHKPDLNLLNYKGLSPLHMAVLEGCRNCVQRLCAAGADVNTKNGIAGRTALHLAVEYRTELLAVLLDQENVLVDTQDYAGNTALHLACSEGNKAAALELMRKDANPLIENFNKCIGDEKKNFSAFIYDEEYEDETDEEEEIGEVELRGKTPFDLAKGNETMQGILAGTVSSLNEEVQMAFQSLDIRTAYTELPPNLTARVQRQSHVNVATSVSLPKESESQHISTDERRGKESSLACTDSGFISAEIKENEDGIIRLCERLDPPNIEWKKLAEVLWDPNKIDQLCKLEKSPTRALLRVSEGNQLENLLEIAGLEEFIPLLRNENPVH